MIKSFSILFGKARSKIVSFWVVERVLKVPKCAETSFLCGV